MDGTLEQRLEEVRGECERLGLSDEQAERMAAMERAKSEGVEDGHEGRAAGMG